MIDFFSYHFFLFQYRNANPVIWPFWDRKFPIRHSWHIPNPVRITLFPHSWLSSWDKKKILHSRLRRSWRIFFLPRLLSQSWGKSVTCTGFGMCHSWLIGNFKNPSLPASPVVKDFSVPKWPNDRIKPFHWSSAFFANGRLINLPLLHHLVELLWNANPKNYKKWDWKDPYLFPQVKTNPTLSLQHWDWICFNFGGSVWIFQFPIF